MMTWCSLVVLMGTLYLKPHFDECTSSVQALSGAAASSYSLWQGCRVEIAPGTWAAWNEIPLRAPHLLKSPGCTDEKGTLCV
jgi:hypothetical protein